MYIYIELLLVTTVESPVHVLPYFTMIWCHQSADLISGSAVAVNRVLVSASGPKA